MEEIKSMVRLLLVLSPLFLLLEFLLPSGELQRIARFVFALIEISILLVPVLRLLNGLCLQT